MSSRRPTSLLDPLDAGPLWAALAEHTSDFVGVMDDQGRALFLNRSVRSAPLSEVLGQPLEAFLSPVRAAQLRHMLAASKASGCPTVNAALQVHAIDGAERWFIEKLVPLSDPERGQLFLLVRTETTDLRKTEEELRASEQQYRTLFDSNPEPVLVIELEGLHVVEANPAASRLYGWSPDELCGLRYPELFEAELREGVVRRLIEETGAGFRGVERQRRRDGASLAAEIVESPFLYAGRPARIAVVRDVTQRERIEEQLRHAQKMEAMGVFAAGVAHDFNNLLSIIAGFTANACNFVPTGSEASEDLAHVLDATRRGAGLTKKLMLFSRREILTMEPIDLAEIVGDFGTILRRVLGASTVLEMVQSESTLPLVGDRSQIEQVILNLVINARQALTSAGRVRVATGKVHVDEAYLRDNPWVSATGAYVEVSVADDGGGMDASTLAHVFEPFFTTKAEGTGLGLAVVHGIVKQHRGHIGVSSTPGVGTTIRILFPIDATRADEPAPSSVTAARGVTATGGTERVLIAEDEPLLRRLTERSLKRLGYEVVSARDGEEALRMFEQAPNGFDLVVLDVVMPKLSGREALLRMRAHRPSLKALFVTGYTPESTGLTELLGQPGLDLLRKPFTATDLATSVRRAIEHVS